MIAAVYRQLGPPEAHNTPATSVTHVCRACGQPRPADHHFCFVCGARLGQAVLPSNRKGFRFAGIGINAPRLIGRGDRLGEQQRRYSPATWLARRWAELTLLALLLWTLGGQHWIPVSIQLPTVAVKPDSWLARLLPARDGQPSASH